MTGRLRLVLSPFRKMTLATLKKLQVLWQTSRGLFRQTFISDRCFFECSKCSKFYSTLANLKFHFDNQHECWFIFDNCWDDFEENFLSYHHINKHMRQCLNVLCLALGGEFEGDIYFT